MKLQDVDLTKESLPVQELGDDVRRLLNNGLYEIQSTASSEPDFAAPLETTFVLSIYGSQRRLYVSLNGAWFYSTLTAL